MGVMQGQFAWYELMTRDVPAARAFYSETIGWRTTPWDCGTAPYTILEVEKQGVGGLMGLPDELAERGVPPHWLVYVAVDDVDAMAKQATELGGEVVKDPFEIPEVGRVSVIKDPQGAVIALLEPSGDMNPHTGDPRPGDFTWHELNTTDVESAWDFYSKLFGWTHTSDMDMGPEFGTYRMYKHAAKVGEGSNGGISGAAKAEGFPPNWLLYVTVDDIDAAARRIEDRGGKITRAPMDVPGGDKVAQALDPEGAAFAIHWRNPNPPVG